MDIYKRKAQRIFRYCIYAIAIVTLASCDFSSTSPTGEMEGQVDTYAVDDPRLTLAMALQDSLSQQLLPHPELVGTGVTITDDGRPAIVVFSVSEPASWPVSKRSLVPKTVRDVPVQVIVTGEIRVDRPSPTEGSISGRSGSSEINAAIRFDRPVPIGVSTGHPNITAGTIGARVTDGINVYALSNNHIYADRNRASSGDAVTQPGRADAGTTPDDDIGTLFDFVPIDFSGACSNKVDAAIALTSTQELGNETPIDGYGDPGKTVLDQTANLDVMKYARTTGLTFGTISAFNVTVEVNYGVDGIACFTDQLIITPGDFSAGGDSGALIVANGEGVTNRPVGLLFAGSLSVTVANPIGAVFNALGVSFGAETGSESKEKEKKPKENKPDKECKEGDPLCEVVPRAPHELYLKVQDGNFQPVVRSVCAYSSATAKVCAPSGSVFYSDANWNAELNGDATGASVDLAKGTKYILTTLNSSNALYYFWEDGDMDAYTDLDIVSGSESFGTIDNSGWADIAHVTATPENVTVSMPRYKDNQIDLDWGSFWESIDSFPFPDFMVSKVTVKIKDGATLPSASAVAFDAYGDGTYAWTPDQTYSNIQIEIIDNNSGQSALSSFFNVVVAPVDASISGPDNLQEGYTGTWTAVVSGGTPSYTYDWDYLFICNGQSLELNPRVEQCDTWNQGGTSSTYQKSVSGAEFDMKLRLTVTDSASPPVQDIAYLVVDIWE
ncbi:MAG: hypothetical protein BMS9Abin05_2641 [Rhodothermia bacterium]|nr:MAG: hypothetical protein BMS9Abin05_2641 [Rhodothermia bacterium]